MKRLQSTPVALFIPSAKVALVLMMIFSTCGTTPGQTPVDNHFTYQGQIKQNGVPFNGSCNFSFSLYAVPASGSALGAAFNAPGIAVANGLFTAQLEFAANAFNGEKRWLEIQAECPAGGGSPATLSPRQELTASPYAAYSMQAANAAAAAGMPWSGLTGVPAGFADGVDNDTQYTAGNGLTLNSGQFSVNTATIQQRVGSSCSVGSSIRVINPDGTVACQTDTNSGGWSLTGNAATTPGTQFLGTTDNQALEFKVNGSRVLRLQPDALSPNLIGGYSGNGITSGVIGGTISGGGNSLTNCGQLGNQPCPNQITDNYGTVGGGIGNRAGDNAGATSDRPYATVGGGHANTASGLYATVGGGAWNAASGSQSTVGGGYSNIASNQYATVGGGDQNTASGTFATVGGGWNNTASGFYSTAPGGRDNLAQGDFSFAAGRRAHANHAGAFVWADSTDADFISTADNQFLIRATGGVGIGTDSPGNLLTVNGRASFGGVAAIPDVPLEVQGSVAGISLHDRTGGAAERWVIYSNETGTPGTQTFRIFNSVGGTGDKLSLSPTGNLWVAGCVSGTNIPCASDLRLKDQVKGLQYGLGHLLQLRPVSWKWKDPSVRELPMGLVAQDVEKVIPELVLRDADPTRPLGLNYMGLMPVVIKAIQEQQSVLGQKEASIQGLYQELKDRDAKIAALEARLAALETLLQQTASAVKGQPR